MFETCTLAVLSVMKSASAIWRFVRPAATSASTSRSRGVSSGKAAVVPAASTPRKRDARAAGERLGHLGEVSRVARDGALVRREQHALELVARPMRRGKRLRPAPARVGRCVRPADGDPGLAGSLPGAGVGLCCQPRALPGADEQLRVGLGQPDLARDDPLEPPVQPLGLGTCRGRVDAPASAASA